MVRRMSGGLTFDIEARCPASAARAGRVSTPHGDFATPAFMPVGTKATVKGLTPEMVERSGSEVLLCNTYHLMLRPGSGLVARRGGLHRFMGWDRPILTDSGGFQVFSLTDISDIDEDGVTFKSHLDGSMRRLTPERSIEVQNELGADIIMAFDDCPPASDEHELVSSGRGTARRLAVKADDYAARNRTAAERTLRWLERSVAAHGRANDQALFGIVQGGTDLGLRTWCAQRVGGIDLPGYAIGGVAVGEGHDKLVEVVEHTAPLLPAGRPRYLMGVGYERDIVAAVRSGVDMFDCVLPTRNGRNANAFTRGGQVRLRNARFAEDEAPIDAACDCPVCLRFSRSYIRHLFAAEEMLGPMLVSWHNIAHFQSLMLDIRRAIRDDGWSLLGRNWPVLGG